MDRKGDGIDMEGNQPLAGKRIVVTRAEAQAGFITSELKRLGANVLGVPTIKIEPAKLSPEDSAKVSAFAQYDAAVFTSPNAVRHLRSRVGLKKGADGRPYVVAIGKRTAEALTESGIVPDLLPDKFNSADLMKSLGNLDWKGKRILIPKGDLAASEVGNSIKEQGGIPDEVVVYNTLPNDNIDKKMRDTVTSGQFDAVVFFSPSQIKNFLAVFGPSVLKGKEVAVIGPTTKKSAENSGITVNVVPENSTTESLVASMVEYEKVR